MPNTLFNGSECNSILFNGQDCDYVYFNGELVFQRGGEFAIEACKNYLYTYSSYAQNLNGDSVQIGRATSDTHVGCWFYTKVPSNFDSGKGELKLRFYRTAGSASGSVTVGCSSYSWTENLTWNYLWYQSSENEVNGTASGNEGWKEINISGLMSLIAQNVNSDGYVLLNIKSEGAYMFMNANPESENAPQVVWET